MTDATPIAPQKVNLAVKIFDCLFSALGVATMLYFVAQASAPILTSILSLGIIGGAIIFMIVWGVKGQDANYPSAKIHAWLVGTIRYSFAYIISVYGFAKVLKTQFGTVYSRMDTMVGSLSGFELTWNYFGYSYKLALILAALQVGGSILLLFRRTTLLGVCILMPVMLNIVLINLFYSIAVGAFLVSLVITTALTYLLILDGGPLIRLFFYTANSLPPLKLSFFKHIIRLLIIVGAFFSIYKYIMNEKPINFLGKWKVEKLERNGQLVADSAWMSDDNAWKYIYVEEHGMISLSPNPYVFESKRAKRASFKYDEKKHKLILNIFNTGKPGDSIIAVITKKTKRTMEWEGTSKNDKFKIVLKKEDTPVH